MRFIFFYLVRRNFSQKPCGGDKKVFCKKLLYIRHKSQKCARSVNSFNLLRNWNSHAQWFVYVVLIFRINRTTEKSGQGIMMWGSVERWCHEEESACVYVHEVQHFDFPGTYGNNLSTGITTINYDSENHSRSKSAKCRDLRDKIGTKLPRARSAKMRQLNCV